MKNQRIPLDLNAKVSVFIYIFFYSLSSLLNRKITKEQTLKEAYIEVPFYYLFFLSLWLQTLCKKNCVIIDKHEASTQFFI